MNDKDRAVLSKVYACVNTIGGLRPQNPADWRAKSARFDVIMEAASPLLLALSSLNFRDYAEANEYADDALAILHPSGAPEAHHD